MKVLKSIAEMRAWTKNVKQAGSTISFIPTMGALHDGHVSLIREPYLVNKSKKISNDKTVVSIFVNPTQFSPGEDLDKYPRDLEKDLSILSGAEVDCVFAPNSDEVYSRNPLCCIEPSAFNFLREGQARPNFFRGVATIVGKLFNIVGPDRAFFGQKDVSQCILIRKMCSDLNFPVDIHVIETLRHEDGLAMSSRNAYLSKEERNVANILFKGLMEGKDFALSRKSCKASDIIELVTKVIKSEPMISRVEYVSVASVDDMKELNEVIADETGAVISSAIRLGNVRLIDNLLVGKAQSLIS